MKRIFLLLGTILLFFGIVRSQDFNIDFAKVDSINIKLIDWNMVTFAYYGINRYQFDDAFNIVKYNDGKGKYKNVTLLEKTIKDEMSIYLLTTILNTLKPYEKNEVKILPDEIMELSKVNTTKDGFMNGHPINGDQIQTRGKMTIYMQNEEIVAYMATTTVDIFNYHYHSGVMGMVLYNIYKLQECVYKVPKRQ